MSALLNNCSKADKCDTEYFVQLFVYLTTFGLSLALSDRLVNWNLLGSLMAEGNAYRVSKRNCRVRISVWEFWHQNERKSDLRE